MVDGVFSYRLAPGSTFNPLEVDCDESKGDVVLRGERERDGAGRVGYKRVRDEGVAIW